VVSERKDGDSAVLRAALGLPQLILEGVHDAVILGTLEGTRIRYWNRAAETIYGWTASEAIGQSSLELLRSQYCHGVTAAEIGATLAQDHFWRGEMIQRHRDGHPLIIEASIHYLRDAQGAPIGILAINRDISATREAEAARRRSEDLLQSALDRLPDAVAIYDPGRRIQFINAAGRGRIRRPEPQILGHAIEEVMPPEIAAQHIPVLERAIGTKQPQTIEITLPGADGPDTDELTYVPLVGADGRLERILGMTRDVSERARATAAIRASEAHLRAIFDGARAAYYLIDRDYRILAFNRVVADSLRRIMGREVAVGDSILQYVMPASIDTFIHYFQRALAGEANHYERLVSYGPTLNAWHELSYFPVRAADGSITGVVFSGVDITTRKRAEASLLLRDRAIGAASTGILIADAGQPDLPTIYVNPACERITGYSAAELLGRNCRMLQGPGTDPVVRQQIHDAIAAGRGCKVTLLNYRKDGRPFWNDLQISPVADESGRITHFIGVQTDVTERVALEAELRHSQKMDTIGRLAGGIAHDFNNLLTVIGGASSFARELLPPEHPVQLELAEISLATERASVLTRHLLTSARKQSINPVVLDLNALLAELQRMLRRLIAENIELHLDPGPALAPVRADAAQLEQVLVNLVVNARDAMPTGGVLEISTRNLHVVAGDPSYPALPPGDHVVIEVHDSGVGMAPEVRAHIFEPFFTTKGPGLGTGLGLSTCYGIVKQHRGHITCDSTPDQGTRFRIFLPADAAAPPPRLPPETAAELPHGSETILLVEDEDRLRAFVHRVLTGLGYNVVTAHNGSAAIVLLAARPDLDIDLLLTDVVMPELGGPELAAYLQSERPALRVLYLSGYHDHPGATLEPLLAKPFSHADLARWVRKTLDS
jgi:PAS domain S-box-containing protein